MFTRYASFESAEVLDLKGTSTHSHVASLDKLSDFDNYRTGDGYLYVRIRAISSRVNKNHDGWPSIELAGSPEIFERHHSGSGFTVEASEGNQESGFATFVGKPIFVDHHNSDPKKARGVIVDAKLNVLDHKTAAKHDSYWGGHDIDHEHLPPTEVELLLEVDAKSFPRLAQAIVSGDLDGFSMGCDVELSKCSHCGQEASSPDEYCSHILMKGAVHDFKTAEGKRVSRKSYENCYGIHFFEISAVFEPADETALAREVRAAVHKEAELLGVNPDTGGDYGLHPDPMRSEWHEEGVEAMAQGLMKDYGMSYDDAVQLAQEKATKENPLPGHGEGSSPQSIGEGPNRIHPTQTTPWPKGLVQPQMPSEYNLRGAAVKTAENPLPQNFNTRAPDEVDTLRDEQLCPICGNDMDAETCQVCGYVQPPKVFDNPDLDKAKQIRQEMKDQEEQQATQGPQDQATQPGMQPGEQLGDPKKPGGPLTGQSPTKAPATAHVTNDMRWTPKVHPKVAARINQVEQAITPSSQPATDEPKNAVVTKDQTRPVTAAMTTAQRLMANAQRNHGEAMNTRTADGPTPPGDTAPKTRVDVIGVGGVDEASNEQASKTNNQHGQNDHDGYAQVDVTGIGTTGISDVAADKTESLPAASRDGDDSGFNTDKTTEDSGPTKTFGDSDGGHSGVTDPVTSEPFPRSEDSVKSSGRWVSYEDKPFVQEEQQGGSVNDLTKTPSKGVEPIDSVGKAQERVNLYEHTTSPENNSGPTKTWSGTDGNGVLKQQEPITHEDQEWGGVKVPDVKLHTGGRISIAALRLAEAELELGLITREDKWNRMIEADQMAPGVIQAKLESYATVKTAGLAKLTAQRQSGVTRVPRVFGKSTAAPEGFERIATGAEQVERHAVTDESLDAGLFLK